MTKLAVFASGRGSNFREIFQQTKNGFIPAEIVLLVSDNKSAGAITFANEAAIPTTVIHPKSFPSAEAFGEALLRVLALHNAEYIVLAGYLKKIPKNVVKVFSNRIVNIHPALLPAFGGKGMYGMNVHRAVFDAGVKVSGLTVHLVNEEYDSGPILFQKAVDISDCTSPEAIAKAVLAYEHQAFPRAVKLLMENELSINGNRVIIKGKNE